MSRLLGSRVRTAGVSGFSGLGFAETAVSLHSVDLFLSTFTSGVIKAICFAGSLG